MTEQIVAETLETEILSVSKYTYYITLNVTASIRAIANLFLLTFRYIKLDVNVGSTVMFKVYLHYL